MTVTDLKPACQEQARNCPACGSNVKANANSITDRYGWSWSLHTCHACGVQYQARPMTAEAQRAFYASGQYRRLCAQVTGQPWDDPKYLREQQTYYAIKWGDRLPTITGRVLDYGGSTGLVSAILCSGDVVVADYGDGATTTPEQALAVPDATYDAILCCQVVDHLPEPLQTLREFRRVAKPGARLFVDVVKLAHTKYKIDHTVYFPRASTFLTLVERSGWDVLWLDGETNSTHYSILAENPA